MGYPEQTQEAYELPLVKYEFGRPSIYTHELLEKARNYLDDYEKTGVKLPSNQGLALYVGIRSSTLYKWAQEEDKKDFSEILLAIKYMRHELLTNGGLMGVFNPTITKVMLSQFGYMDKQEQNQGVSVTINIDRECQNVTIEPNQAKPAINHED